MPSKITPALPTTAEISFLFATGWSRFNQFSVIPVQSSLSSTLISLCMDLYVHWCYLHSGFHINCVYISTTGATFCIYSRPELLGAPVLLSGPPDRTTGFRGSQAGPSSCLIRNKVLITCWCETRWVTQEKSSTPRGLLQPLTLPKGLWSRKSMSQWRLETIN